MLFLLPSHVTVLGQWKNSIQIRGMTKRFVNWGFQVFICVLIPGTGTVHIPVPSVSVLVHSFGLCFALEQT